RATVPLRSRRLVAPCRRGSKLATERRPSMSQVHELPAAVPEPRWATVDSGPALPMAVYTCSETWNPQRIGALAVYCSDGRWGEAFDEFCHKRLLIPRYDRWAVAGGPALLTPREAGSDHLHATR